MDKKISVIIPVYNSEAYLDRCLKSMTGQTYKNIEVIVIDDGSTDNSPKILDIYAQKDNRIKVFHEKNCGVTKSREKGIRISSGEYLCFLDSDDWYEQNALEIMQKALTEHSADISICSYNRVTQNNIKPIGNTLSTYELDRDELLRSLIMGIRFTGGLWAKLFKRELLVNEELDPSIRYNEDVLLFYKACKNAKKAVFTDFCAYNYYIHLDSSTYGGNSKKQALDSLSVSEFIKNDLIGTTNEQNAQIRYTGSLLSVYKTCIIKKYYDKDILKDTRKTLVSRYKKKTGMTKSFKIQINIIRFVPFLYPPVVKFYKMINPENLDPEN